MLDTSRFTDRSLKVLQLAKQEAARLQHSYTGTEHLLLGLVKEGSGVACNALKNLDINIRSIRIEIEKVVEPSGGEYRGMGPPLTGQLERACDYAKDEAGKLGHKYIGTEHLLLGLLRQENSIAQQILRNLNVDLPKAKEEVMTLLGLPEPTMPTIVCLCGSTRFKDAFIRANFDETMTGKIVLSVGLYSHADKEVYSPSEEEKRKLDELHLRKIDLADEVLFLNVGGYIGESTKRELEYARKHGKIIRFLEGESG